MLRDGGKKEGEAECKVSLPPKPRAIPSVSSLRSLCRLMKCLSGSMLHLTGMHTFSFLSRGVLFSASPSLCDLRRLGGGDTADHTFHMHRRAEKEWEDEEKWEKRAQEAGGKDLRR